MQPSNTRLQRVEMPTTTLGMEARLRAREPRPGGQQDCATDVTMPTSGLYAIMTSYGSANECPQGSTGGGGVPFAKLVWKSGYCHDRVQMYSCNETHVVALDCAGKETGAHLVERCDGTILYQCHDYTPAQTGRPTPQTSQTKSPTSPTEQQQTKAPTTAPNDKTEAPTSPTDRRTEAPTSPTDQQQTKAPTAPTDRQTEAPTAPTDKSTEAPTAPTDKRTEAPTDKPQDTRAPTPRDAQTKAPSESDISASMVVGPGLLVLGWFLM